MFAKGYIETAWGTARMLSEAQAVMAYRMLGTVGLWPTHPSEIWRMSLEKAPVFAAAGQAATMSALAGDSPDRIAAAWLKPINGSTHANHKRLSKRR